jgi:hypothetical protein
MTLGRLNSWKLRYFRLEGGELVYYEKESSAQTAEENFQTAGRGRAGSVAAASKMADAEGREATQEELAQAFVQEQSKEEFTDKNVKSAINMAEVVDVQVDYGV